MSLGGGMSGLGRARQRTSTVPPAVGGTWPRFGAYWIGSTRNYYDHVPLLGLLDVLIISPFPSWEIVEGKSVANDVVIPIHNEGNGTLVGLYVIMNEAKSTLSSGNDNFDVQTKLFNPNMVPSTFGSRGQDTWWAEDPSSNLVPADFPAQTEVNQQIYPNKDSDGKDWAQWKAERDEDVLINRTGGVVPYDFTYIDNIFYRPRVDADWDADGTNDGHNLEVIRVPWRIGCVRSRQAWKDLKGESWIVCGNFADLVKTVSADPRVPGEVNPWPQPEYVGLWEGGVLELYMGRVNSPEGSYWDSNENFQVNSFGSFNGRFKFEYQETMEHIIKPPALIILHTRGPVANYQYARYRMTAIFVLGDAYAGMHNLLAGSTNRPEYYDEMDQAGTSNPGWLGAEVDAFRSSGQASGVYWREMVNGLIVCNPRDNGAQTITLPFACRAFSGTQDPTVNNGALLPGGGTLLTIGDMDGRLLLRD